MDQYADRPFLNAPVPEPGNPEDREIFTFGEVKKYAVELAAWLVQRGTRQGDNVGVVGFNSAYWVIAWTAVHIIGAVPVMVNAATQPDSQVHCLKIARPAIVLCDAATAAALAPHQVTLADAGIQQIYSWQRTEHLGKILGIPFVDFKQLDVPPQLTQPILEGRGFGLEDQTPESDGNIFFTSGTTGYPKAVLSSQRAALHNVISSVYGFFRTGMRQGATVEQMQEMVLNAPPVQNVGLMGVPFFHVTGNLSILLKFFTDGNQLVLMRRWNVDEAVRLMVKYKVNVIGGVPAIVLAVMQSPKLPKDFPITGVSYGGAPSPERLAGDIKKRWPEIGLASAWGMTETNAPHTAIAGEDFVERPKSCGYPLPVAEVRIVDPDTRAVLKPYERGMIQARGMTMMKGYLNDAAANAKSFDKDGWFETGDAGYLDNDGFLFISDRFKDIVIRGGENISSEEVENAIYQDDRIAEAACVAVPDDLLGELVALAVSLRPGAKATPEEIMKMAAGRLRSHARPAFVWVSEELLPRNANGKLIKTEIKKTVRELYAKRPQQGARL